MSVDSPDLDPPVPELAAEPGDWGSSHYARGGRKDDRGLYQLGVDPIPGALSDRFDGVAEHPT
jgi:hypothetical protein